MISSGDGTITEFDGAFDVTSYKPTISRDADDNRIANVLIRLG